jgi:phosphoribosylaminoimidazole-succinocarboxamide synthase
VGVNVTLGLTHLYQGKVRDLYTVDDRHLLMVASDRLSAFDVVMNEAIPNKGRVLTALTDYWLHDVARGVPSALVSCNPNVIDEFVHGFRDQTEWHGRAMLVRRAEMLPIECIVRARLAGSSFDEYQVSGTVHHMAAPPGMKLTDAFPRPLFTPAIKVNPHDINIDVDAAAEMVGADTLKRAQTICFDLFARGAAAMAAAGLVLADTKFELGVVDGRLVVCDEVLTPDSSRIWAANAVVSGEVPASYDKQPFRDWLISLSWDRTPPPPAVPSEVVETTSRRYVAAYEAVTGKSLNDWYGN